jgi:hypothetical protein
VTGTQVTIGLDAAPAVAGPGPPGSTDARADTAVVLDLGRRTGQAWIRDVLDPIRLDYRLPAGSRPDPVHGWRPLQLIINRPLTLPSTGAAMRAEFQNVGELRHGSWDPADPAFDSRALWRLDGDTVRLRLPWPFAGLADPSSHQALVPALAGHTATTPGLGVTVTAGGSTESLGTVHWRDWNAVGYTERLKAGADQVATAMLAVS